MNISGSDSHAAKCIFCGSMEVEHVRFDQSTDATIEIEILKCVRCRREMKFPHQNRVAWLRESVNNITKTSDENSSI